jgi:hypothetical protein
MFRFALLRRLGHLALTAGASLLLVASTQSIAAEPRQDQQTSQSQQNPQPDAQSQDQSRPKPKKVWTNDDVLALRTPADNYLAEKEAQEAANVEAAAKKAALEKEIKEAALSMKLPSTVEETQGLIATKQDEIIDFQKGLNRLKNDLAAASTDQKPALQQDIDSFTGRLKKAQLELRVLQDHLDHLMKAPPTEPVSPQSPP